MQTAARTVPAFWDASWLGLEPQASQVDDLQNRIPGDEIAIPVVSLETLRSNRITKVGE